MTWEWHVTGGSRRRAKAATMAITFALTVCSVPVAVFWRELREALIPPVEYSARLPDRIQRACAAAIDAGSGSFHAVACTHELPRNGYGSAPTGSPTFKFVSETIECAPRARNRLHSMQILTRQQSEVAPSFGAAMLGGRSEGRSSALEAQHEPTVRVVAELGLARCKLEFAEKQQ